MANKDDDIPLRIGFLMFIGVAITILSIMSVTALWKRDYLYGGLFLTVAAALTLVFYRKRMVTLYLNALGLVFVLAGPTAIFHPSIPGILLTVGSAVGIILLIRWHTRKFPTLTAKDWKTMYDNK